MFTTKIKDHFVTKIYGVIFNHFQLTTHCYNIQLILILSDVHIDAAKVFRWSINTIHFLPCEYNPWCVSWKPFKRVVLSLYNDSVLNKKNFSIFFLWKILPTKIANPFNPNFISIISSLNPILFIVYSSSRSISHNFASSIKSFQYVYIFTSLLKRQSLWCWFSELGFMLVSLLKNCAIKKLFNVALHAW